MDLQVLIDGARLICIALAITLLVALIPVSTRQVSARGIAIRNVAIGVFVVIALLTTIGRWGTPLTWRLPLNLAGVTLTLAYVLWEWRKSSH